MTYVWFGHVGIMKGDIITRKLVEIRFKKILRFIEGDIITRKLFEIRFKKILPFIEGNLLDIACGMNELVRDYYKKGIGVDIDSRGGDDVLIVKDSSKLEFEDKSFDTITIIAALNHITNRLEVLKEANRVLKDDGKIIVTMIPPKFSQLWHFLRRPWADELEKDFQHGQVYGITSQELKKLLNDSGFEVVLHKKFMLRMNSLMVGRKIKH